MAFDPAFDFLELYLYAIDHTTVPQPYHVWSCLGLVGACLNDRVWFEKFPGKPLYPWLYCLLVGRSGSGKDVAIEFASGLLNNTPAVFEFYGRASGAGLADILNGQPAKAASAKGDRPTVWLVFPELSMSIGEGRQAKDFIRRLTGLSGGKDKTYREATRALMMEDADISYGAPLINALMGSTKEWLVDCVTESDMRSGFFARVFAVDGQFDISVRGDYRPKFPADYDDAITELHSRVRRICKMEGEFVLSEQADAIMERWYYTRPLPQDDREEPLWLRQEANIYKIGMVMSAMSGRYDYIINSSELKAAQRYVNTAYRGLPSLLQFAARTADGRVNALEVVAEMIKRAGRIQHSPLLKKLGHHGMHGDDLKKHIQTLVERGDIENKRNEHGGKVYTWVGR